MIGESSRAIPAELLRTGSELGDRFIAATNVIFVHLDIDGRVVRMNHVATDVLGYSQADVAGKNWFETLAPRTRYPEVWSEFVRLTRSGGVPRTFQNPVLTKSGEELHIAWQNNPVIDGDAITGTISFGLDVTERVLAERYQTLMLGVLGHDLCNPINAIVLVAESLARSAPLGDGDRDKVQRIVASARRMGHMVEDLLDITRLRTRAGLNLTLAPADLNRLCRQVADELRPAHPDRTLECHFAARGEGEWDATRLTQVVSNLVGNALRHGREGTPVRLTTRDAGDDAIIEIHNEGEPIGPEARAFLFQPFWRPDTARATHPSGLGLGLFIAHQIVEEHGGELTFESSSDAGTTFRARLPRKPAP
jgi:PAS domain S-box-containing protein